MQRCTGDLVAWLNSDDYYWSDALWTVGRAWAAEPGFGLYVGNGFRYNQAAGAYTPFSRRHVAVNRTALLYGLDYLLQPACFFRRGAWREAGGLNEKLHFCMDWDLLLRIAQRHPAVLINEFLAVQSREYEDPRPAAATAGSSRGDRPDDPRSRGNGERPRAASISYSRRCWASPPVRTWTGFAITYGAAWSHFQAEFGRPVRDPPTVSTPRATPRTGPTFPCCGPASRHPGTRSRPRTRTCRR